MSNRTKPNIFKYSEQIHIYYKKRGVGETKLIFLHGFGSSSNTWDEIVTYFPEEIFTLYLLDLKGFGESTKIKDGDYTLDDQATIINTFIVQLKIENYVLIGHSYGGCVGLLLVADERFIPKPKKLIILDCAPYKFGIPFFLKFLRIPVLNILILTLTTPRFRSKYILSRLFYNKNKIFENTVKRYEYSFSQKGTNYTFIQCANKLIPLEYNELINKISKIDLPTLIIWGQNDPVSLLKYGQKLHGSIINSCLEVVKNCGHIPHEEEPEVTTKHILKFLES